MPTPRRELTFRNFDEVNADVENLRARGYSKAGNWNLAQVCGHLAMWMSFPMTGYPRTGPVMKGILWLLRNAMGKRVGRKILAADKYPPRGQTLKGTIPPATQDEAQAVAILKDTIERLERHTGVMHSSPLFGRLSRADVLRLQMIHCAHHLSHLVPA